MRAWLETAVVGFAILATIGFGFGYRISHLDGRNVVLTRVLSDQPDSDGPMVMFHSVGVVAIVAIAVVYLALSFVVARALKRLRPANQEEER